LAKASGKQQGVVSEKVQASFVTGFTNSVKESRRRGDFC
jgi:hypothetical protein